MRESAKWKPGELREAVETAVARSGCDSTYWIMHAFGLSYSEALAIKQRMADNTPDRPCPGAGKRSGKAAA